MKLQDNKNNNKVKRPDNPYFNPVFEARFIACQEKETKNKIFDYLKDSGINKGNSREDFHLETTQEAGEDKEYFVYLHYDPNRSIKLDGEDYRCIYVGITFQNSPEARWNNGGGYSGNKKFAEANEVYKGQWNDWELHCIIAEGLSEKAALALESLFIEMFDSFDHGLNKNEGGAGRPKGVKFSEEEKAKLRKSHRKSGKKEIVISYSDGSYVIVTSQNEAAKLADTAQPNISDYCNGKKEQRKNGKPRIYWLDDYIALKQGGDSFVY